MVPIASLIFAFFVFIVGMDVPLFAHTSPPVAVTGALTFPIASNDHFEEWLTVDHVFSPQECDTLIAMGNALALQGATTDIDHKETKTRNSRVAWLYNGPDTSWLYERLSNLVQTINASSWKFDITGFHEAAQFTAYEGPGTHYAWHTDSGNKQFSKRKISIVCQLSDPNDYMGGGLEFFKDPPHQAPKTRGTCVLFPSFTVHRVVPLTHGKRYSLVMWTSGPPFR